LLFIDLILLAACLVYILAAANDVVARIIPDTCSLALLLLGLSRLILIDGSASAFVDVATAAGTFIVLVMLCMAGLLGGGDAKLIAASTFFLGFERLADFFSTTALSGGILALLYLIGHAILSGRTMQLPPLSGPSGSRHGWKRRLKVAVAAEHRRVARKQSIPYGVAIAAGALISLGGLH
jgi:prepilin peptidase CpaA